MSGFTSLGQLGGGQHYVQVDGLAALMEWTKQANPELNRAMKRALRDEMQPVLQKAKGYAGRIADDGTFQASLTISQRSNGTKWFLRSTDPAAGVKEFARPGAKRAIRTAAGVRTVRVGVPHKAVNPRVMVPAIEHSEAEIMAAIDERMAEVMDKVER